MNQKSKFTSLCVISLVSLFNGCSTLSNLQNDFDALPDDLETKTRTLEHKGGGSIQTYEFNQSDAKIAYKLSQIDVTNNTSLESLVFNDAVQKGFSESHTEMIADLVDDRFGSYSSFDPEETSFANGHSPAAGILNSDEPQKTCIIFTSETEVYKAQDMFAIFTGQYLKPDVQLPEIYNQFYEDYINLHEEAHCLEANEEEAEFIATLSLLNKYNDSHPTEIQSFLEHQASLRHFNTLQTSVIEARRSFYQTTGQPFEVVIENAETPAEALEIKAVFDAQVNEIFEETLTKPSSERHNHNLTGSATLIAIYHFNEDPESFTSDDIWDIARNESYPDLTPEINVERELRKKSIDYVYSISIDREPSLKPALQKTAPGV